MQYAITGSSGFIGSALTALLEREGDTVLRVRRGDRDDATALWNPAEGWFRDGALEGMDGVVHLTGVSVAAKGWSAERKGELRAARIDATHVLVDHLLTLTKPPCVLVCASANGYYGANRGDEVLKEGSLRGSGFLADLVRDWEAAAARAESLGIRVVNGRFGITIDRDGELMKRILLPFKMGVGGTIGSCKQWFSWVMVEDVARAIAFALKNETLRGPVNMTSPQPVTNREFAKALGRALHRPTLFPVPTPALRIMFGKERATETVLANQLVLPERLQAAGFTFTYPDIESALAADFSR